MGHKTASAYGYATHTYTKPQGFIIRPPLLTTNTVCLGETKMTDLLHKTFGPLRARNPQSCERPAAAATPAPVPPPPHSGHHPAMHPARARRSWQQRRAAPTASRFRLFVPSERSIEPGPSKVPVFRARSSTLTTTQACAQLWLAPWRWAEQAHSMCHGLAWAVTRLPARLAA